MVRTANILLVEILVKYVNDPRPDVQKTVQYLSDRVLTYIAENPSDRCEIMIGLQALNSSKLDKRDAKIAGRVRYWLCQEITLSAARRIAKERDWTLVVSKERRREVFLFKRGGITQFRCVSGRRLSKERVYDLVASEMNMGRYNVKRIAVKRLRSTSNNQF
jgi:hypothetical protein